MSVILGAGVWVFVWSWETLCSYSTKKSRSKFCGLISYCVISWDYLSVFTDKEVGTRLFSVALEDIWVIKLLRPWKNLTVLKVGLQRKIVEQKKRKSVKSFSVNQHRVDCEQDPEFMDSQECLGTNWSDSQKNGRCSITCPCFSSS